MRTLILWPAFGKVHKTDQGQRRQTHVGVENESSNHQHAEDKQRGRQIMTRKAALNVSYGGIDSDFSSDDDDVQKPVKSVGA